MNVLSQNLTDSYGQISKNAKGELREKYQARFGYQSATRFESIVVNRTVVPTVNERHWLAENIVAYWNDAFATDPQAA